MNDATQLDRFYDVPATVTAMLVGGPFDGEERPFPEALIHQSVFPQLVLPMPAPFLVADFYGPPRLTPRAIYEARRDGYGFVPRDDQGRITFEFWGLQ